MGQRPMRQIADALETVFRGTTTEAQEAMNETKAIRIASVKYAGNFKLRLPWVNRSVTLVDLTEPIHRLSWSKKRGRWPQCRVACRGGHGCGAFVAGDDAHDVHARLLRRTAARRDLALERGRRFGT